MANYAFRERPVPEWTDADFSAFRRHVLEDELPCPDGPDGPAPGAKGGNRVRNLFDSQSFRGAKNSPFAWHREVKARLGQAGLVAQDLEFLRQCAESGRLDALSDEEQTALFDGMASKMAVVRYGYEAGRGSERSADYKSHMAMTMKYGGVAMVQSDVDQWRSGMQEMLNAEYDKATRPGSRYICRFFNRDSTAEPFDASAGCVFYGQDLLDAYVQEYVADRQSAGEPIRDMFKFTTAAGDYDLKYRITKAMAVGQGLRVMPKEDWVNNSKAQAAFSGMAGWGVGGTNFEKSCAAAREAFAAGSPDAWLVESRARVERANKLYEDLELLSELPLDAHGSLKYQPSFSMCVKCGWAQSGDIDRKTLPKVREAAFRRELLLRTVDVLYGPDAAKALQSNFRKAVDVPVDAGSGRNDIQAVWDELCAGKFEAVKDRVVEWSGERLDVIEQEALLADGGAVPAYSGSYGGAPCAVRSDAAAVALMGDVFRGRMLDVRGKSDGLKLPVENLDLMYGVYAEAAKARGESTVSFKEWHAGMSEHPEWDMAAGEFGGPKAGPAKPKYLSPEELAARFAENVPAEFLAQEDMAAPVSGEREAEAFGFDDFGIPAEDAVPQAPCQAAHDGYAEAGFAAVPVGRDTYDIDAAAALIQTGDEPYYEEFDV